MKKRTVPFGTSGADEEEGEREEIKRKMVERCDAWLDKTDGIIEVFYFQ